jgi:hypothetical protein
MTVQSAIKESLEHLFEIYKASGSIGSLTEIAVKYSIEPVLLANNLEQSGYLRHKQVTQNSARGSITWGGINKIAPDYIENFVSTVIGTAGITGGRQSLAQILNGERDDIIFDCGKYLESINYIEAVQYKRGDVHFDLSLKGRDYYEKNKASFQ